MELWPEACPIRYLTHSPHLQLCCIPCWCAWNRLSHASFKKSCEQNRTVIVFSFFNCILTAICSYWFSYEGPETISNLKSDLSSVECLMYCWSLKSLHGHQPAARASQAGRGLPSRWLRDKQEKKVAELTAFYQETSKCMLAITGICMGEGCFHRTTLAKTDFPTAHLQMAGHWGNPMGWHTWGYHCKPSPLHVTLLLIPIFLPAGTIFASYH